MELNEINGFDGDGNPTTIRLPVSRVVKQALLALDYSQGALENQMAANQLADQFSCLSYRELLQEKMVRSFGLCR